MASARSHATIEVRNTRRGDEQGISRLSMLAFMTGRPGPWNGSPETGQWIRYRGHQITRTQSGPVHMIGMLYSAHDGNTAAESFTVGAGEAVTKLRNLDDLIDIIIDRWPLRDDENDEGIPTYTTAEGTTISDVLTAGALVEHLEGTIRHVHDLIRRGASLDEIEAGIMASRSAHDLATAADLSQFARDDEAEGKAAARADEWPLADDGSDLSARERNGDDR